MKKRILALFLAVVFAFTCLPLEAFAGGVTAGQAYGSSVAVPVEGVSSPFGLVDKKAYRVYVTNMQLNTSISIDTKKKLNEEDILKELTTKFTEAATNHLPYSENYIYCKANGEDDDKDYIRPDSVSAANNYSSYQQVTSLGYDSAVRRITNAAPKDISEWLSAVQTEEYVNEYLNEKITLSQFLEKVRTSGTYNLRDTAIGVLNKILSNPDAAKVAIGMNNFCGQTQKDSKAKFAVFAAACKALWDAQRSRLQTGEEDPLTELQNFVDWISGAKDMVGAILHIPTIVVEELQGFKVYCGNTLCTYYLSVADATALASGINISQVYTDDLKTVLESETPKYTDTRVTSVNYASDLFNLLNTYLALEPNQNGAAPSKYPYYPADYTIPPTKINPIVWASGTGIATLIKVGNEKLKISFPIGGEQMFWKTCGSEATGNAEKYTLTSDFEKGESPKGYAGYAFFIGIPFEDSTLNIPEPVPFTANLDSVWDFDKQPKVYDEAVVDEAIKRYSYYQVQVDGNINSTVKGSLGELLNERDPKTKDVKKGNLETPVKVQCQLYYSDIYVDPVENARNNIRVLAGVHLESDLAPSIWYADEPDYNILGSGNAGITDIADAGKGKVTFTINTFEALRSFMSGNLKIYYKSERFYDWVYPDENTYWTSAKAKVTITEGLDCLANKSAATDFSDLEIIGDTNPSSPPSPPPSGEPEKEYTGLKFKVEPDENWLLDKQEVGEGGLYKILVGGEDDISYNVDFIIPKEKASALLSKLQKYKFAGELKLEIKARRVVSAEVTSTVQFDAEQAVVTYDGVQNQVDGVITNSIVNALSKPADSEGFETITFTTPGELERLYYMIENSDPATVKGRVHGETPGSFSFKFPYEVNIVYTVPEVGTLYNGAIAGEPDTCVKHIDPVPDVTDDLNLNMMFHVESTPDEKELHYVNAGGYFGFAENEEYWKKKGINTVNSEDWKLRYSLTPSLGSSADSGHEFCNDNILYLHYQSESEMETAAEEYGITTVNFYGRDPDGADDNVYDAITSRAEAAQVCITLRRTADVDNDTIYSKVKDKGLPKADVTLDKYKEQAPLSHVKIGDNDITKYFEVSTKALNDDMGTVEMTYMSLAGADPQELLGLFAKDKNILSIWDNLIEEGSDEDRAQLSKKTDWHWIYRYFINISMIVKDKNGNFYTISWTGDPDWDDASWTLPKPYYWRSYVTDAFAELKETRTGKMYAEDYEAMAGTPTTENLYYAVGGDTFVVQIQCELKSGMDAYRDFVLKTPLSFCNINNHFTNTGAGGSTKCRVPANIMADPNGKCLENVCGQQVKCDGHMVYWKDKYTITYDTGCSCGGPITDHTVCHPTYKEDTDAEGNIIWVATGGYCHVKPVLPEADHKINCYQGYTDRYGNSHYEAQKDYWSIYDSHGGGAKITKVPDLKTGKEEEVYWYKYTGTGSGDEYPQKYAFLYYEKHCDMSECTGTKEAHTTFQTNPTCTPFATGNTGKEMAVPTDVQADASVGEDELNPTGKGGLFKKADDYILETAGADWKKANHSSSLDEGAGERAARVGIMTDHIDKNIKHWCCSCHCGGKLSAIKESAGDGYPAGGKVEHSPCNPHVMRFNYTWRTTIDDLAYMTITDLKIWQLTEARYQSADLGYLTGKSTAVASYSEDSAHPQPWWWIGNDNGPSKRSTDGRIMYAWLPQSKDVVEMYEHAMGDLEDSGQYAGGYGFKVHIKKDGTDCPNQQRLYKPTTCGYSDTRFYNEIARPYYLNNIKESYVYKSETEMSNKTDNADYCESRWGYTVLSDYCILTYDNAMPAQYVYYHAYEVRHGKEPWGTDANIGKARMQRTTLDEGKNNNLFIVAGLDSFAGGTQKETIAPIYGECGVILDRLCYNDGKVFRDNINCKDKNVYNAKEVGLVEWLQCNASEKWRLQNPGYKTYWYRARETDKPQGVSTMDDFFWYGNGACANGDNGKDLDKDAGVIERQGGITDSGYSGSQEDLTKKYNTGSKLNSGGPNLLLENWSFFQNNSYNVLNDWQSDVKGYHCIYGRKADDLVDALKNQDLKIMELGVWNLDVKDTALNGAYYVDSSEVYYSLVAETSKSPAIYQTTTVGWTRDAAQNASNSEWGRGFTYNTSYLKSDGKYCCNPVIIYNPVSTWGNWQGVDTDSYNLDDSYGTALGPGEKLPVDDRVAGDYGLDIVYNLEGDGRLIFPLRAPIREDYSNPRNGLKDLSDKPGRGWSDYTATDPVVSPGDNEYYKALKPRENYKLEDSLKEETSDQTVYQTLDCTPWTKAKYVKCSTSIIIDTNGDNSFEDECVQPPNTMIELDLNTTNFRFYLPEIAQEYNDCKFTFFATAINDPNPSKYSNTIAIWEGSSKDNSGGWTAAENYFEVDNLLDATPETGDEDRSWTNVVATDTAERKEKYARYHDSTRVLKADIVGLIGNLTMVDTGDFRYSNFFKEISKSGKWIVDNIVKEVNLGEQARIVIDDVDIFKRTPTYDEGNGLFMYNTYLSQTHKGVNRTVRDWRNDTLTDAYYYTFPLMPSDNNINAYKKQAVRIGYDVYMDVETIGDYSDPCAITKIVTSYYAYDRYHQYFTPVDVYMTKDGKYELINKFDNGITGGVYNNAKVYSYPTTMNWDEEKVRRMFTAPEEEILGNFNVIPSNGDEEHTTLYPPSGAIVVQGNKNTLALRANSRTYIGNWYLGGNVEGFDEDGFTGVGRTYTLGKYNMHAQKWYFSLGLPSSAVFVLAGKPCTAENIKEISKNYDLLIAASYIYAIGPTWTLQHDGLTSWCRLIDRLNAIPTKDYEVSNKDHKPLGDARKLGDLCTTKTVSYQLPKSSTEYGGEAEYGSEFINYIVKQVPLPPGDSKYPDPSVCGVDPEVSAEAVTGVKYPSAGINGKNPADPFTAKPVPTAGDNSPTPTAGNGSQYPASIPLIPSISSSSTVDINAPSPTPRIGGTSPDPNIEYGDPSPSISYGRPTPSSEKDTVDPEATSPQPSPSPAGTPPDVNPTYGYPFIDPSSTTPPSTSISMPPTVTSTYTLPETSKDDVSIVGTH